QDQSGFLLSGLFSSEGMEQVFVWPSCYNHQLFSFQEALDWRSEVCKFFLFIFLEKPLNLLLCGQRFGSPL
ncbi:unnamed protein product, partial [Brassica rapa]